MILAAAFALAITATGLQQTPFDARIAEPSLLKHEIVQRELKLTPDQITQIEATRKAFREEADRTGSWHSEKERAAVAKHLNSNQLRRLREITIQHAGPVLLMVDFVAERIGASPTRHKELKSGFDQTVDEGFRPMRESIQKMAQETMKGVRDPEEAKRLSKEVSKRSKEISSSFDHRGVVRKGAEKMLSMLSASERKTWNDLQGAPFPVEKLRTNPKDE